MGIINFGGILRSNRFKRIIIFATTFIVIYGILITSMVTKKYNLKDIKEGEIAKFDIKAQRDIKNESETQLAINNAENSVPPQYSVRPKIKETAVDNVNKLFLSAINLKDVPGEEKDKITKLKTSSPISLSDDDFSTLTKLSKEELKNLQEFLINTLSEIFDTGIECNPEGSKEINDENLKNAQDAALLKFNSSKLSKTIRDLGTTIANSQITPNSYYDKDKTDEEKRKAIKSVVPVMIKKDQIIVKEGEPITKYQIEQLKDAGMLNNGKSEWYIYISLAILIVIILSLQVLYLHRHYKDIYNDSKKLILINVLNCIALILARTLSLASPYLVPLACIPMLMTLLVNYKVSLTLGSINCILVSVAVGFNVETTILAILNSVMGAVILRKMQQRNDILFASIYIAIINALVTLSVGFLLSNNIVDILSKVGFSAIAAGISGVLTIGFLPFFETTFDIVTIIKLLELSNPNHALLKKLLIEAPGTYHHSIMVANLAEVAAEVVGGNPVLARVAAYYHDVGKIKRPYFFKENQMGNDNPHNKITPNLSSLIIISHVKDGIELAKEHKLPKVIRDVIEQHHGTSLVKYFYITAKNSSENPDTVCEEDFKYSGPIPSSKESGIVMLADSIEASVRSINEPTSEKIESMVNKIIKERLNDGQLDDCELTLKDINNIKQAFLKTLGSIYHHRIEYPVDKWENKKV